MITFVPWRLGHSNRAIDALVSLELTDGLKLCLDAGDASSYGGSGQTWADVSGNGYDFFRGTSGSAEGSDPTFNGSGGDLDAYWSFDGGDYFTLGQSNPTWVNNLHKDGAKLTILFWVMGAATSNHGVFGTRGAGSGGNTGIVVNGVSSIGGLIFSSRNGSTNTAFISSIADDEVKWQMRAVSLDENGGAGASFFWIDGAVETFNGAYTSPTASDATFTAQVGSFGNGFVPMADGSRMAAIAVWEGVTLTPSQINAIYEATRGRFGI